MMKYHLRKSATLGFGGTVLKENPEHVLPLWYIMSPAGVCGWVDSYLYFSLLILNMKDVTNDYKPNPLSLAGSCSMF